MIHLKNIKYFQKLSEFPHSYFFIKKYKTAVNGISPSKTNAINISGKIFHLLSCFKRNHCGISLAIEELCPNGLDLTDGILIVKSFEMVGVKFIIINIEINNFLASKKKQNLNLINISNYAWLSGIACLIENTKTPIYVSGDFKLTPQLIISAKRCGISGLLQVMTL